MDKKLAVIDGRIDSIDKELIKLVEVDVDEQKQINNLKTMLNGMQ